MYQLRFFLLYCCTFLVNKTLQNDQFNSNSKTINVSKNNVTQSTEYFLSTTTELLFLNNNKINIYSNSNNNQSLNSSNETNNKFKTTKLFNKTLELGKIDKKYRIDINPEIDWKCPIISRNQNIECGCDMPHTLRCSGNLHGLEEIADGLRESIYSVSLLDCTLKNVTILSYAKIFQNVSLHGLVISSGEIKRVHRLAFIGTKTPLQALGLPNNALLNVPSTSLAPLTSLDRLDLSNNKIKSLSVVDFATLQNLTYLELSENQISYISLRTFSPLNKLITLKLNGNRLGDLEISLQAIGQCLNLRELDLKSNSIRGALTNKVIVSLKQLESLNLGRNIFTSVQNGALQGFPRLVTLSLRHNQIDVLQDHAFLGLNMLQSLDLGYNGIVAISGASLQHLPRLVELDLTHNFLRALTSDLIAPLPSLRELRLDGNDISIVAKNALDGATELHSLSLQDNPLSCDCSLKPFTEWLSISKIASEDLLGAVCATPPHLEGAPLLQVPIDSFKCFSNDDTLDNANVIHQLEILSKQKNNLSHITDSSDLVTLRNIRYLSKTELVMIWNVNLMHTEFSCDAIFVYQEDDMKEILLDNSPVNCENTMIGDQNIVSFVLTDLTALEPGKNYRFCLVLVQEQNKQTNLIVGCSNIIKLEPKFLTTQFFNSKNYSDISSLDKITTRSDEITRYQQNLSELHHKKDDQLAEEQNTIEMLNNITTSKSFLPGLGFAIILTSLFILIWIATKFRSDRPTRPAVTTLYTATNTSSGSLSGIGHPIDMDGRNRYVKLQATTSL